MDIIQLISDASTLTPTAKQELLTDWCLARGQTFETNQEKKDFINGEIIKFLKDPINDYRLKLTQEAATYTPFELE